MKKHSIGNNKHVWSKMIDQSGYLVAHGGASENRNNTPFSSFSLDLEWEPIPGAKSYAVLIEDYDSTPVIGFAFVHWVALNIKKTKIEANQSYLDHTKWYATKIGRYADDILWQGHNSSVARTFVANNKSSKKLGGILPEMFTANTYEESLMYFGCYPPNADHIYTLTVYGLDVEAKELSYYKNHRTQKHSLNKPYYVGDFMQAIHDHIVDKHTLHFKYAKVE
ncbi:YbhB/YbcL family Raf kinase inhibitor-like protein [Mycoplasma sp. E35C]|uniref:YbhB/YbcL family Raf kinase inhibitor-like protein n=1 Tax=Mycoplasma sp. E35C TaxID=2801918 RepID=UPI001CA38D55|nr:YbhB/YbcL family Raf kinase inhibitor-like protein [Mycoplasma sp. E35C]QZX49487.1 YbhB/YbcL family Raf kinase inhibitor-like protein [Mycoplasma sp. E35C]